MATQLYVLASQNWWRADGSTETWNINFAGGYIDREHVKAWVRDLDGVITPLVITPADWLGPNQIRITPAVVDGHTLAIYRSTPKTVPLVDFTDRANLSEADLDTNAKQAIFAVAEASDLITLAPIDSAGITIEALVQATAAVITPAINALKADLADTTLDAKGAGMLGFDKNRSYALNTIGAAVKELIDTASVPGGGSGGEVVATVAALRLLTGTSGVVRTHGYWSIGDGGAANYELQPVDAPPQADNSGTVIVRQDGRFYTLFTEGPVINVAQLGVYCPRARREVNSGTPGYKDRWHGAVPSPFLAPAFLPDGYSTTDWLLAAFDKCRALGKGALIPGIPHCDKQVLLNAPIHLEFAGRTGDAGGNLEINLPDSYLFAANTGMVGSVLLRIEHPGVTASGGGVVGPVYYSAIDDFYYPEGLARDGLFIGGNGVRWNAGCFARMGRDGIRIGDYPGGAGTNANSVYLDGCTVAYNGQNGLTIDDAAGALDANAFSVIRLKAHSNQFSGIHLNHTFLGGAFFAPTVEHNGRGWFIDSQTSGLVIIGGDTEANTGWRDNQPLVNVLEAPEVVGLNFPVGHTVQGAIWSILPDGTKVINNKPGRTGLFLENKHADTSADVVLGLESSSGQAGLRKRSAAVGGELLVGNQDARPVGFMSNNIIHWGLMPSGAFSVGGFSAPGTPGQVFTSQGPGAPPIWSSAGGSSPLTTKGDLYVYGTGNARLPVGTNGHALVADSTQALGVKWAAVAGVGTVTSVGMTVPLGLSVTGSPITGSGTFGVAWAAGYQGFTTAEAVKLAALNGANYVVKNASSTISLNGVAPTALTVANTNVGGSSQLLVQSDAGTGGISRLGSGSGGQTIFGNSDSGEVAIMHNGLFRILVDATGNIEFRGLPSGSSGAAERVWRDGSGYLRIG